MAVGLLSKWYVLDPQIHSQPQRERVDTALQLMVDFCRRTGLSEEVAPERYLWTDAFAVCNLLGLAKVADEPALTVMARGLVDQVHHTLGKHRDDDPRRGWISGLDERDGERNPTLGGLRIGKPLPERRTTEPYDERLEWERDGQYFHYLARWIVALDAAARAEQSVQLAHWSRELARVAYAAFSRNGEGDEPRRLAWKMSIDLSRPLVASMGQHDALDGFVTCLLLRDTATAMGADGDLLLSEETDGFADMVDTNGLLTADALGIGGLLVNAHRLHRLGSPTTDGRGPVEHLLSVAAEGLRLFVARGPLHLPTAGRVAFRELGLAIGLAAAARMATQLPVADALCAEFASVAELIVECWLDPANRNEAAWVEHRDICDVMLATALVPEGFLNL